MDPLSGVRPRLYETNANGQAMATPKTQSKTKFLLPSLVTSLGVRAKAIKAVVKYTIKNIEI